MVAGFSFRFFISGDIYTHIYRDFFSLVILVKEVDNEWEREREEEEMRHVLFSFIMLDKKSK